MTNTASFPIGLSSLTILPLQIEIYWCHGGINNKTLTSDLADIIYRTLNRNPLNPLDRALGIPCLLYPKLPDHLPQLIEKNNSIRILLIDNEMLLSAEWKIFLDKLIKEDGIDNLNLLPIILTKQNHAIPSALKQIQYLDLSTEGPREQKIKLLINLLNWICKLIFFTGSKLEEKDLSEPIFRLFLSHAKHDGEEFAIELKEKILQYNLDYFFDANHIIWGFKFKQQIDKAIDNAIVIVNYTDSFSESDWTNFELIKAKKKMRPILVINKLENGTQRASPYIGNLPHLRLKQHGSEELIYENIIVCALIEAIRTQYHKINVQQFSKILNLNLSPIIITGYAPSTESLANIQKEQGTKEGQITYCYPDPPIGNLELSCLNELFSDAFNFVTPSTMLNKILEIQQHPNDINVSFSISETDLDEYSFIDNYYLQDLAVELTRYLLLSDCRLIYSGDLDYKKEDGNHRFNFAKLLYKLIETYKLDYSQLGKKDSPLLDCYLAFPYSRLIKSEIKEDYLGLVNFIPTENTDINLSSTINERALLGSNSFEDKLLLSDSLSYTRSIFMEQTDAHISFGGKWKGFKGIMPGVLEEILLALENKKPLFLIGGLGGVTQSIVDIIHERENIQFQDSFFQSEDKD
ncbi:MAG: TIR domain-containing protein [Bacteroidota bacterium]